MLPFITYLQRVDLSPGQKADSKIVDPLDRSEQKTVRSFPSFQPKDQVAPNEDIDTTTTGSVMSNGKGLPGTGAGTGGDGDGEGQSLPKPVFALREVVGGMAMIEDTSGYWFVEKARFCLMAAISFQLGAAIKLAPGSLQHPPAT